MDDFERQNPPVAANEREMLVSWLDYHRATLLRKAGGLDDAALRQPLTPSGLTLLGLVKHLAYVERWWFQAVFAGRAVTFPWSDADPDAEWRIEPSDTTPQILELYRQEVRQARAIVEAAGMDDLAAKPAGRDTGFNLRWIMVHMIEETARHNGHADIMREMTDGQTGE